MSGIVEPPIITAIEIKRYTYQLIDLIPHTSVQYYIHCYNDIILVKTIIGLLEGEQYKEWTTDDWIDRFIKSKVDELRV